jgi:hypothetical protein
MPQLPELHDAAPPTVLHTLPHALQLAGSVFRLTSQPFATLPSQSASPARQAIEQTPLLHAGVPVFDSQ